MGTVIRHRDKLASRQRQQEILQRRMSGQSADDIAKAMHLSIASVYRLISKALQDQQHEDVVAYRAVDGLRIERLIASHWDEAVRGSTEATKVIVRLLDHRAKLFGLYAPTKIDANVGITMEPVYGDPDLQEWARGVSKRLGEPLMSEADALALRRMMDAQVIPGEVAS